MQNQRGQIPWYDERAGFFGRGYLKEYSNYLTKERTLTEVNFLEKTLQLRCGDKILDCPCGHGRHSIELSRRSYNVTGQDLNSFFIQEAKKEASHLKTAPHWIKGDMREIPFEDEFDVALCLFSSFGYLENDNEDQKFLNQIAIALKENGKFVLDVINRNRFIRLYKKRRWKQLHDGSIVISENNFDQITGRNLEKRVRIWKNGMREEVSHFVRMYTIPELVVMLRTAGFVPYQTFGDYSGEPITFFSKRYIFIAKKI
ncbi:MAG: class I SAM-dependent methyltransferase [Candidatus Moranbacteria bacterium]|nr:class I SAM-dependent methyltransferase [Candidatus Moranbacteria bacterium]